ncbi:hypothetical protein FIU83_01095 [Halomonas sp. THAF5a]|uniref:hypothetical protein n=1 Tax=Halomonas sp. THAF5a TaxID=2587844 RepID=UPI0012697291|nr:hypothetical protein [Halomonas sp. THAF5a]QFU00237.1 hypothetical protein FIU83_01095 [Halomonas sp. THAF5a]
MSTIPLEALTVHARQAGGLVIAGLLLLALGALLVGWQPVAIPLELVALGASGLALLTPGLLQQEEARETLYCLTLASLVTLVGIQLLA